MADDVGIERLQEWVFAPADDFDVARTRFLRFFVDAYFPAGHVYVDAGSGGAAGGALWAPPDRDVLDPARIDLLLEMMGELLGDEAIPRLTELARSGAYRPQEPHFYLGVLGIDPSRQGEGLGGVHHEPSAGLMVRRAEPGRAEPGRAESGGTGRSGWGSATTSGGGRSPS